MSWDSWKQTDPDPRPEGRSPARESKPAPHCVVCGAELFAFYTTLSFGGAYCTGHTSAELARALRVVKQGAA